jgi:hypothetical protein
MSKPVDTESVKLVMSVFSAQDRLLNDTLSELHQLYGEIDYISSLISFDYTNYYTEEMGSPLYRRFISFETLVRPETLPDIKWKTNGLEEKSIVDGWRRVNIDPGYIWHAHLILATGKGYTHRPYLRDGIYADLTLIYQKGTFQSLPWTYPDYAAQDTIDMFNKIRSRYVLQVKECRKATSE